MGPATKLDADAFFELKDERQLELVNGEVVPMPDGGGLHGDVGQRVNLTVALFVKDHRLGAVPAPNTGFELAPDLVRKPDIAFVPAARWRSPPPVRWLPGAPALAVEIISPSDVWSEVEAKAQEYLDHGSDEVWLVSPFSRTVQVWRRGQAPRLLGREDALTTPLLPGLSASVASFFP